MKNWSLILLLCISAIYAKPAHDTIYVEQIIRDTVYIPIKSKTDTIYINGSMSPQEQTLEHAPKPKCCEPTERNPLGKDTTKFLRYDTTYTHHLIYLHFDIVSILWLMDTTFTSVGGNIEFSANRKNSFMINFRYSKMQPQRGSSNTFNDYIYTGNISQYDIGMGYRHYFRPSKYSFYYDVGGNWLIRKYDYINTWDFTNLINERPHSRHDTGYLFSPYIHLGHIFRGSRSIFGIEYGLAYNATDKELLNREFSYITGGIQLDFRLNFGIGVL